MPTRRPLPPTPRWKRKERPIYRNDSSVSPFRVVSGHIIIRVPALSAGGADRSGARRFFRSPLNYARGPPVPGAAEVPEGGSPDARGGVQRERTEGREHGLAPSACIRRTREGGG